MKANSKARKLPPFPISSGTEKVGKQILDAGFKVHTALGPGLLESAYEACMLHELQQNGLDVKAQTKLPVTYENIKLDAGYRIDLLVENCVIVELKAVEKMVPLYEAQLLTYMKLAKIRLGYLLNFNVTHFKHGIKRMVL